VEKWKRKSTFDAPKLGKTIEQKTSRAKGHARNIICICFYGGVPMSTRRKERTVMNEKEERRLESIREKLAKIKAEERLLLSRDRERQRKARTRRLILMGGLMEKYVSRPDSGIPELEHLLRRIVAVEDVQKILNEGLADEVASDTTGHAEKVLAKTDER